MLRSFYAVRPSALRSRDNHSKSIPSTASEMWYWWGGTVLTEYYRIIYLIRMKIALFISQLQQVRDDFSDEISISCRAERRQRNSEGWRNMLQSKGATALLSEQWNMSQSRRDSVYSNRIIKIILDCEASYSNCSGLKMLQLPLLISTTKIYIFYPGLWLYGLRVFILQIKDMTLMPPAHLK